MNDLDPSSFHFRYATDRRGVELAVPDALNVRAFHLAMLSFSNYPGAVIDHLDAALELQWEYEAEMSRVRSGDASGVRSLTGAGAHRLRPG